MNKYLVFTLILFSAQSLGSSWCESKGNAAVLSIKEDHIEIDIHGPGFSSEGHSCCPSLDRNVKIFFKESDSDGNRMPDYMEKDSADFIFNHTPEHLRFKNFCSDGMGIDSEGNLMIMHDSVWRFE